MRILVTGASGYIGSALVPVLAEQHEVYAPLDCNICINRPPYFIPPDGIIHLACDTRGDWQVNVLGTANVTDWALQDDGERRGRLIFASTLTAAAPQDGYDVQKRACEELIRCRDDIDAVILRLGRAYGPPIHSNKRSVLNKLIASAAHGDMVSLYGNAYALRDYVYLDDVVQAFALALEAPAGTYDVGTGEPCSLLAAGQEVAHQAGVQWYVDDSARDGPAAVAAPAQWLLGWHPTVSLEEGIARTLRWAREQER